jgi:hypothetical protein
MRDRGRFGGVLALGLCAVLATVAMVGWHGAVAGAETWAARGEREPARLAEQLSRAKAENEREQVVRDQSAQLQVLSDQVAHLTAQLRARSDEVALLQAQLVQQSSTWTARPSGPSRLAAKCPYVDFRASGSFDPQRRYVALSAAQLAAADARNPFSCSSSAPRERKLREVIQIVLEVNRTSAPGLSSGFGSTINVMVELGRYAATTGRGLRLPGFDQWMFGGARGAGATTWTTFFLELSAPECVAADAQVWSSLPPRLIINNEKRHQIRMSERFSDASLAPRRNAEILRQAGLEGVVNADNDVQAMRLVFRWMFQLQPATRARVDEVKAPAVAAIAGRPYIGLHVRWGDKVRSRMAESELFGLELYAQAIACFYAEQRDGAGVSASLPRVLFVATDDFAAVTGLRELLGTGFEVVTLADESAKGHTEHDFNKKSDEARFREVELLWADMELLAGAELFVGNQKSNIWRAVHHLRYDKPAHSSLSVHTLATAEPTCCVGPPATRTSWVSWVGSCATDCTA